MKRLSLPALAVILAALAAAPAAAQHRGGLPRPAGHAINPNLSLSAPAINPLQQQMQDDYATQLMQSQQELLQQNSSGLTRQELAIGHQLDGYTAPR